VFELVDHRPLKRGIPPPPWKTIAMTSKHYLWQKRWTIDAEAREARHESGLIVRFLSRPGHLPTAIGEVNRAEIQAALEPKHGHNAAAMIARMLREAAQLYGGNDGRR
jgi:hypothetical protein